MEKKNKIKRVKLIRSAATLEKLYASNSKMVVDKKTGKERRQTFSEFVELFIVAGIKIYRTRWKRKKNKDEM